jgi:lysophospholipase L1-like esterase
MRIPWRNVLLAVVSAVGCVVAVDLAFLVRYGPVRLVEDFYEPQPDYGYKMRPNLDFVFASPYHGYEARVRTNSQGLRDDEVRVPKPPGVFRVLLIGDSFTASLEVDKEETFESVCERRLRLHGPVEVVNCGVRGYNLDNILGFLAETGLAYQPDAVVYLFTETDLTSDSTYTPVQSDESRGLSLHGFLGRIATYSHLTYRLELLSQMVQMRRARDRHPTDGTARVSTGLYLLFQASDYSEAPYRLTAARICRLGDLTRQAGATFVLVGAPHREEVDPETQVFWRTRLAGGWKYDFDSPQHFLASVAASCSLGILDVIPEFRRQRASVETFWFHNDGHMNARAQQLMGELLAGYIEHLDRFESWESRRASQSGAR